MTTPAEERIPLLDSSTLRDIRRADKKLYRALAALSGRVAAQVVGQAPQDLLLWVYLTGVAHGAESERRSREAHAQEPAARPADSGRLRMNPTHLPTRGDHGPDQEPAISPEAE